MSFLITGGLLGPVGGLLTGGLSSGSAGGTTLTDQDIANIVAALVASNNPFPSRVTAFGVADSDGVQAAVNARADSLADRQAVIDEIAGAASALTLTGVQGELATRGVTSTWTTAVSTDFGTLKTRVPGVVQPQTGDAYAKLAPLISGSAFTAPALAAAPTSTGTISGRLAADGLDNVMIDGMNMRQALSVMGSVLAGVVQGASTTTITYLSMAGTTPRVIMARDQYNGRSAVQYVLPS